MSSLEHLLNHNDDCSNTFESWSSYHTDLPQSSSQSEYDLPNEGLWAEPNISEYPVDADFMQMDDGLFSQTSSVVPVPLDSSQVGMDHLVEGGYASSTFKQAQDVQVAAIVNSDTPVTEDSTEVCLGMIYRASVKLIGDMSKVKNKLKAHNQSRNTINRIFDVQIVSEQICLTFEDATELGALNVHISKAVEGLMTNFRVRFDALADLPSLYELIDRVTKASDAVLRVNINVYGVKEQSNAIGRALSKSKVYLQRPDHQRPNTVYDNPHVLDVGEMNYASDDIVSVDISKGIRPSDKVDDFQKTVTGVYASLKRSTHLKKLEGDDRLKTALLPHQKEALDFMIQREVGPVPPEFALWRPIESDGQTLYRHAVTQAKASNPPPETGGGILADEMGMGKSLSILNLITHRLADGHTWEQENAVESAADIASSERLNSRATLIVVSSALLINNWLNEILIHVDGTIKVLKYHGQQRRVHLTSMKDYDIVITTYHTLAADFIAKRSPLHRIAWFRIVLDEAHIIRRQATKLNRTVSELSAKSRWCLTGTPIQNRLEDIGALFAFIRARPFDSMAMFRRFVAIPFDESEERRSLASQRLSQLIDSLCIRRTREMLDLPEGYDQVRIITFSKEERVQYERTKQQMIRAIGQRAGEYDGNSKFGMFQAQLQLRILCNHGTFQHRFSWARSRRNFLDVEEYALAELGRNGETNCSSCGQSMPIMSTRKARQRFGPDCAHCICSECLDDDTLENEKDTDTSAQCPLCSLGDFLAANEAEDMLPSRPTQEDDYFRSNGHSSKMVKLVSDVQENLWVNKSIIFTCWTRTLTLVSKHLRERSVPFDRIDGGTPLAQRQMILDGFAKSPKIPVLIMTTGTGAYGLNLTSANRVFLVEPQWNPSVENQAISRAMRLGQGKSVLVTRYVVERTVEQEMRSQQNRKRKIAQIGWD